MRQNALLLERKPAVPPSKRAHTGRVAVKESNQRWCSDGFEFCCDNGERLRVTFALDCCDREALHWAVTTGGAAGEQVVPASELAAAMKQIKELQRLLGKKTMENELLKEAVEYGRAKKWIAHAPLLPGDGE
ncbi:IS2 ORF2 [Shigella sonnei]|nr:IS2 ORF2 [Shigella sonnei]